MDRARQVGILIAAGSLSACASGPALQTTQQPADLNPTTGVPYALPYAYVPVSLSGLPPTGNATAYTGNVTMSAPVLEPDPNSPPLFLQYTHDPWADDSQTITVSQGGLLEGASLTSTDQTVSVINEIAQLVGLAAELPLAFSAPLPPPGAAAANLVPAGNVSGCTLPPIQWMSLVDPADRSHQAQANDQAMFPTKPRYIVGKAEFVGGNQTLDVNVYSTPLTGNPTGLPSIANLTTAVQTAPIAGIVFRTPMLYLINVNVTVVDQAAQCHFTGGDHYEYVAVPNAGNLFVEDMSRAPAVKKTVTLTIQDGMLVGVSPNHPSENNAYAAAPVTVLTTILSIPSSLLTLHVQQTQAEGNLTAGEAALIQDEINLANNKAALKKLQAPPAQPTN